MRTGGAECRAGPDLRVSRCIAPAARMLDRKLSGILEIYQKFQGVNPRTTAMKIFPAVHYSMGGLWCDYERTAEGGLARLAAESADQCPGNFRYRRVRLPISRGEPAGGEFAGGLHFQRPELRRA